MRVVPVLDIQHGVAVHGVAGQRDQYRPVATQLVASSRPIDIARAWRMNFGFRELYLADLTAIAGGLFDVATYQALLAAEWHLWLDAGINDWGRCSELLKLLDAARTQCHIIVALESLPSLRELKRIAESCDTRQLVFSLDLFNGQIWNASEAWLRLTPTQVASEVAALGIPSLIVLDVASVGTSSGPSTLSLCEAIRQTHPELHLLGGGGVRDVADLARFAAAGCNGVLVATALHDGRITAAQLRAD